MENLKSYDDFINEEINFGDVVNYVGTAVIVLISGSLVLLSAVLVVPYLIFRGYYQKFYKKNWAMFARGIQTMMDLLWTYSYYIKKIEDSNYKLQKEQIKGINKAKKKLIKAFGKSEITKDEIKEWCREKFDKISKEEDRGEIYDMINQYDIKTLPIDRKLTKKLKNIYGYIEQMLDINKMVEEEEEDENEVDPFNEEDWDEDDANDGIFYYLRMSPKSPKLGKAMVNMNWENYGLNGLNVSKEVFNNALQKYVNFGLPFGKNISTWNAIKSDDKSSLSVVPENNRRLFVSIVKHNWKVIKIFYNKYAKSRREIELRDIINESTPENFVGMLDDGYRFMGNNRDVGGLELFSVRGHYLLNRGREEDFQNGLNRFANRFRNRAEGNYEYIAE